MKNRTIIFFSDLAKNYGTSNIDASNFKIKLPGKMFFDPLKNPLTTFRSLQNQNSILRAAGNPLTDAEFKSCIEIGLEPPETAASFWLIRICQELSWRNKGVNGPRLLKISEMLGLKDNSKHGRELEYAKNCRGGPK
jgi:hypothetical protein